MAAEVTGSLCAPSGLILSLFLVLQAGFCRLNGLPIHEEDTPRTARACR
jgi:hypothetical protein